MVWRNVLRVVVYVFVLGLLICRLQMWRSEKSEMTDMEKELEKAGKEGTIYEI